MSPTEYHIAIPSPDPPGTEEPLLRRATVHAGGVETTYLVAGSGLPVVLLHGPRGARLAWGALAEILRDQRRLLSPEGPAPAPHAFSAWLRSFLDGLGYDRVGIVAQDEFALAALTYALLEPDRVERLLLVHDDHPDTAVHRQVVADRLSATGHPLLIVRRPGAEACPESVRDAIGAFFGVTGPRTDA